MMTRGHIFGRRQLQNRDLTMKLFPPKRDSKVAWCLAPYAPSPAGAGVLTPQLPVWLLLLQPFPLACLSCSFVDS
jgi:hypothetical protein